jgi:crotonobetainyl-CoA:carnitine CoA-transferase CaiB-like acyl-CoA transferase
MALMMGEAIPRVDRKQSANPLWNHYRCQDDKWIALAMLQSPRYWGDFVRALGRPELAEDPRFDVAAAPEDAAELVAIFDEAFATRTRDDWMKRLRDAPGDFIFTIVNEVSDLPDDPQMRANDYVVEFDHPQYGPTPMVGMPVRLSETPGSVRLPAPELGQHTEETLIDWLGYDWDRIAELRKHEVI